MPRTRGDRTGPPPIAFDGWLYWYRDWFDERDDWCCCCRAPIGPEDVPLVLFREQGHETWMARVGVACGCAPRLLEALRLIS